MRFSKRMKWGHRMERLGLPMLACWLFGWHHMKLDLSACHRCGWKLPTKETPK